VTSLAGLGEAGRKMVRIAHRFINSSVATVAIHGRSRVSSTDVTTHTSDGSVGPSQGEAGLAMIKYRSFPLCGAMAGLTILREPGGSVIRIGRGIEVLQMASDARGAQSGVLAAAMAIAASERNMGARQWKLGLRMIKLGSQPGRRRVAQRAILRESASHMVGICGSVICAQMAGGTIRGCPRKPVVSMALGAGDINMGSCERKACGRRVVETSSLPLRCRMASAASLGKSCRFVIGVRGSAIIRQVAGHAVRWRSGKPVVQMTLTAADSYVSTGQRKFRCAIVIKARTFPLHGVVTNRAVLRETCGSVIGVGCRIVVCFMATHALSRRPSILAANVTLVTTDAGM
jgi:hypothetical protein